MKINLKKYRKQMQKQITHATAKHAKQSLIINA